MGVPGRCSAELLQVSPRNQQSSLAWKAGRLAGMMGRRIKQSWQSVGVPATRRRRATEQDPRFARWYANLEIPYGSDLATVKRARKRLLSRYHPDRHCGDPERARKAVELTLAIQHAYEQLAARLEADR